MQQVPHATQQGVYGLGCRKKQAELTLYQHDFGHQLSCPGTQVAAGTTASNIADHSSPKYLSRFQQCQAWCRCLCCLHLCRHTSNRSKDSTYCNTVKPKGMLLRMAGGQKVLDFMYKAICTGKLFKTGIVCQDQAQHAVHAPEHMCQRLVGCVWIKQVIKQESGCHCWPGAGVDQRCYNSSEGCCVQWGLQGRTPYRQWPEGLIEKSLVPPQGVMYKLMGHSVFVATTIDSTHRLHLRS